MSHSEQLLMLQTVSENDAKSNVSEALKHWVIYVSVLQKGLCCIYINNECFSTYGSSGELKFYIFGSKNFGSFNEIFLYFMYVL